MSGVLHTIVTTSALTVAGLMWLLPLFGFLLQRLGYKLTFVQRQP